MALFDPNLQRLRDMMMIQMKLMGKTNVAIAKEFNLTTMTVDRSLTRAKKAGLFVQLEQKIMDELIPAGFKALKTAMEDGDAETAMELFKSLGILKDPKAPKTEAEVVEDNELQKAISEQRTLQETTFDGEVLSGGRNSLAGLLSGDVETTKENIDEKGDTGATGTPEIAEEIEKSN